MSRCTAVEILELDDAPCSRGPEGHLSSEQRLPLLEEVWSALTEQERWAVSCRLNAKQHGVHGGEGRIGSAHVTAGMHEDWGDVGTEAGS